MTQTSERFFRSYFGFVGLALLSATVIAALGYVPTIRVSGQQAVLSMVVGCCVSWLTSSIGAIPLAIVLPRDPSNAPAVILGSTALRFLVVMALVVPLTFSGWVDRKVFVFWVGVSYVLMLLVDTAYALLIVKRMKPSHS